MTNDKSIYADQKVKMILTYTTGGMEDLPSKECISWEFDASDLSAYGWVCQFRKLMAMAGFMEKTITEYLGNQ